MEKGKPVGVGTPGYAAPEQFIGGTISSATDIHALGVLAERIVSQKEWGSGVLQKERLGQSRRFLLPHDAAYNEVRFGGPATLKELNRLLNEESMDRIRRE